MPDYLELLRPLLEHSNVLYFAYDLSEQRVVYVSEVYEQLLGDPVRHLADDLPGLLASVHPDDWHYLGQLLAAAPPGTPVQDVELRLTRARDMQWLSVSVMQVQAANGPAHLTGSIRDITPTKKNEFNAQKFNTKKDATLEILAHDLATPLALMQQLTEQLSWEVEGISDMGTELLRLMQRACTQGVTLIRDFVDNEFLESANIELKRERTELVHLLGLVIDEYRQSQQHMGLLFSFEAAEQPIYASLDVNKFQQVVNNLISNSIKFTPDGGSISLRVERNGEHALLTVTDTGVGIPADLQEGLFERFTRSRRPGLRGEKANGLGMSIIKTILNLHQSRIWLESAEGAGAKFYIELPALPT
ncbi:PAS domain S-box protein [Hymenobacter sp. HMF4947]|uniref:histidine kinase n=1 Tax=Hymenobacter ginkgonis TaxID=2682976 RepID=A0A7K1TFV5_9BACT|nr:PAS domain-containing sensor histidine kinase [Hymenobacter ginkgonis]MVN77041.1 PAS domain S-box protein [Hymenobacter ginkgonis]